MYESTYEESFFAFLKYLKQTKKVIGFVREVEYTIKKYTR